MKKRKMLITLAGLVTVVATTATVAAYTLTGDGSGAPAGESAGTQEPAFQDDKPTFDPAPDTIDDGKGGVSVINPDVKGDDPPAGKVLPDEGGIVPIGVAPTDTQVDPPLHGDPPPPVGRPLPEPIDGTDVPGTEPVIEPIEPGEVVAEPPPLVPTPNMDHEDADDQAVRVGRGTGLLIDPLLATGAEVKLTGEVVSEDPFSVDGRVLEVNGERVLVMDYGDAAALEAEAAGISPDGSSVGTHMVTWVGSPHFFRTETAIVLYVGENPKVIEALTSVLGPQFAGR